MEKEKGGGRERFQRYVSQWYSKQTELQRKGVLKKKKRREPPGTESETPTKADGEKR